MKNKKQTVIKVSTQLFAEQGFENTSISEICKIANVSKGLVYHHFKSKNEILQEIFRLTTERMMKMNVVETKNSPGDQLTNLIEEIFSQLKNDRLFFQLNLGILFQPSTKKILQHQIKERSSILLQSVQHIFDQIDPEKSKMLSYIFIAEIDGISLDYLSVFEDYPIEELKNHLLEKYKT